MKANHKSTAHPKELLTELQALAAEAQALIADSATEATHDAVGNLRDRFEAAQEKFSDIYDGARKKAVAGAKYADTTIRENPYQAMAVAAGVGLLVGVILGRRGK